MNQALLELIIELKDQASTGLHSLGDSLRTVGGIALGAGAAGIAYFGSQLVSGVQDAREANQVMAQTEAVITSTGGAAGVTAQQIADYASSLSAASGKSLFGDSDIQTGQNLLLTFTNINETLPDTTKIMVDMAQAMGTDVSAGAIQLGKALNDPIKGVGALSEVGVTFTDQQREQIKAMQEAGDMAGAQRVILAELNKEFGGSAEAAAIADGGIAQFTDSLGETWETIGGKLLPMLNSFAAWLNSPEVQQAISVFAEQFANGVVIAADFVANQLVPAVVDLYNWLAPRLGPILTDVGQALQEDLPRGVTVAVQAWHDMQAAMADFKETYIDPVVRGYEYIAGMVGRAQEAMAGLGETLNRFQVPDWLQGHSPPPMADWFGYIADAASAANAAMPQEPGRWTPPALGGAGRSGMVIQNLTINLNVQTSDPQAFARQVLDVLAQYQRQNVTTGIT